MGFFKKLFKSTTESGRTKLKGLEEVQENEYDVYGEIYDQCNTAHEQDIDSFDGAAPMYDIPYMSAIEMYENAVTEIEKRMIEQRGVAGRPEDIKSMRELQLREEEAVLHRELWILKRTFGKPKSDAAKQTSRSIYFRYHLLKREKLQLDKRLVQVLI